MSTRGRKPGFYVYRLFDDPAVTLYVGKGCGRRLSVQKRRFNCSGEILRTFERERDAFAYEVRLIAELQPTENKHKGGCGGRATLRRKPRPSRIEREMKAVGPRRYVAMALLGFDLSGHVAASKIDEIRQVVDGPWR